MRHRSGRSPGRTDASDPQVVDLPRRPGWQRPVVLLQRTSSVAPWRRRGAHDGTSEALHALRPSVPGLEPGARVALLRVYEVPRPGAPLAVGGAPDVRWGSRPGSWSGPRSSTRGGDCTGRRDHRCCLRARTRPRAPGSCSSHPPAPCGGRDKPDLRTSRTIAAAGLDRCTRRSVRQRERAGLGASITSPRRPTPGTAGCARPSPRCRRRSRRRRAPYPRAGPGSRGC